MFPLEHQATEYKSKQSSATTIAKVSAHMNISADMDDNRDDDERLLNQALDDVEQLFCVDDDDELIRLANALNSDQQQQQQTTTTTTTTTATIPRQYLLDLISVAIISQCISLHMSV